jgi:hypothetical protein
VRFEDVSHLSRVDTIDNDDEKCETELEVDCLVLCASCFVYCTYISVKRLIQRTEDTCVTMDVDDLWGDEVRMNESVAVARTIVHSN